MIKPDITSCRKLLASNIWVVPGFIWVLENTESPGISLWHFWDFPWKNTSGPRKVWKSVKLKLKNIVLKYMAGSKEN